MPQVLRLHQPLSRVRNSVREKDGLSRAVRESGFEMTAAEVPMTIVNLGTRVVNNYLIPSEAGRILIDTGYAGGFAHFQKMLAKHGVRPEEIRYVFLTHAQRM